MFESSIAEWQVCRRPQEAAINIINDVRHIDTIFSVHQTRSMCKYITRVCGV